MKIEKIVKDILRLLKDTQTILSEENTERNSIM